MTDIEELDGKIYEWKEMIHMNTYLEELPILFFSYIVALQLFSSVV